MNEPMSRKEFALDPRQLAILLLYNHKTGECKPLEFGGKSAAVRALQYQEKVLMDDENMSSGLIMNHAAEVEFENTLLSELGCPHEVEEGEFDEEEGEFDDQGNFIPTDDEPDDD
jgi:hypothetical protein